MMNGGLEGRATELQIGKESTPLLHETELSAQAATGQAVTFAVSSLLGPNRDPLSLTGLLTGSASQTLELNQLEWRKQALLDQPLRISFAAGETTFSPKLQLAQIDDHALRPLFALVGIQLPDAPNWQLRELFFSTGLERPPTATSSPARLRQGSSRGTGTSYWPSRP